MTVKIGANYRRVAVGLFGGACMYKERALARYRLYACLSIGK